jgi:hypothetical protein
MMRRGLELMSVSSPFCDVPPATKSVQTRTVSTDTSAYSSLGKQQKILNQIIHSVSDGYSFIFEFTHQSSFLPLTRGDGCEDGGRRREIGNREQRDRGTAMIVAGITGGNRVESLPSRATIGRGGTHT